MTTNHNSAPLAHGWRTLASGRTVFFYQGHIVPDVEEQPYEGPTCSICDALGHGYPGGPPCPLEDSGEPIDPQEASLQALDDERRWDAEIQARERQEDEAVAAFKYWRDQQLQ